MVFDGCGVVVQRRAIRSNCRARGDIGRYGSCPGQRLASVLSSASRPLIRRDPPSMSLRRRNLRSSFLAW
jgi:hypothetical protein